MPWSLSLHADTHIHTHCSIGRRWGWRRVCYRRSLAGWRWWGTLRAILALLAPLPAPTKQYGASLSHYKSTLMPSLLVTHTLYPSDAMHVCFSLTDTLTRIHVSTHRRHAHKQVHTGRPAHTHIHAYRHTLTYPRTRWIGCWLL